MKALRLLFFFYFGCLWGSFLLCQCQRQLNNDYEKYSHCHICNHRLFLKDLFPLFSFLFLKGKCRYCHNPIDKECFWSELVCGILYSILYHRFGLSFKLFEYLLLINTLFMIAYHDYKSMLIPTKLIYCLIIIRLVFISFTINPLVKIIHSLINGLTILLPVFITSVFLKKKKKKECLGDGDLWLLFSLGLYLGLQEIIIVLFISCILGLLLNLIYFKKLQTNSYFPFAPALALGFIIFSIWEMPIMHFYLQLF